MKNSNGLLERSTNALIDTICYPFFKSNVFICYDITNYKHEFSGHDHPRGVRAKIPVLLPRWRHNGNVNNLCIIWQ